MNADLKTSYPITDADPGAIASITLKSRPCLSCNYPTTEGDQLCSIACRSRVERVKIHSPITWDRTKQKIMFTPGCAGGNENFGSFRRNVTADTQS